MLASQVMNRCVGPKPEEKTLPKMTEDELRAAMMADATGRKLPKDKAKGGAPKIPTRQPNPSTETR